MEKEKFLEVWINNNMVSVIPIANEQNMREHLEDKYPGKFHLRLHNEVEEQIIISKEKIEKLDINEIKKNAKKQAEKEKTNLNIKEIN